MNSQNENSSVQIDGQWHYFYPDGSLAVNTKIDGSEVDVDGVRKVLLTPSRPAGLLLGLIAV